MEWDSIDWDEKVENILKNQRKQQEELNQDGQDMNLSEIQKIKMSEDDGNYYEINKEKNRQKEAKRIAIQAGPSKTANRKDDIIFQPYSLKDLQKIRDFVKSPTSTHKLIFETFGQFERFLLTHRVDLTHESLVELLNIDVNLLEIPFHSHNQHLLREISKLNSFWSQVIHFLEEFLANKHKDLKFLLSVDMNGFIENIEYMMHNLLVNNFFSSEMELVFTDLISAMGKFAESKWSCSQRLQSIQDEYRKNFDVFRTYDIFPTVGDLKTDPKNLLSNVIDGEYKSVAHYLQVNVSLLREDFISKLRDGVQQLKAFEPARKILKTSNVWIHAGVQITTRTELIWNLNCRTIVVKLNLDQKNSVNWIRRLFLGQMLCFSSSKEFNDLVVAVVIRKSGVIEKQADFIQIEIIQTENIEDIFDRDLIMFEPLTFFEPYHRVFNVMKNLNELNFPFKDEILHVCKDQKLPKYEHPDIYTYKNYSFRVNSNEWPSHNQLNLEQMQLKAIQAAVTNEFTVIQGPPGTGKTFTGLEILKILLENTNETILVLTQTNNALDRFLLGASAFTQSIARMGSQCKLDELTPFVARSSNPLELKKYLKKMQLQLQVEVEKLMEADENITEIHRKMSLHHRLIEEINQLSSFYSIRDKRVVGMTTTFAAKNCAINKMLKPGIVIIEEASEVLESHVLVSLTKHTKQLIMIGDHQQLKPLTSSYNLARNFNFNVSLFERLIKNGFNFITLDVQMRMAPDICDLVRGTIYKTLKDGANVASYPKVKGMSKSFFCVNHSQPETFGDGETSKENLFEAEYIAKLCDHLIKEGNDLNQITILAAYAAQAQRIRTKLKDLGTENIRVAVLDAFQGEESDIILLSLVRSSTHRDIGFLATENRIAVLLSRAKFGFYIIANMDCLASASTIWKKVREIMREKQIIGKSIPNVTIRDR